MKNYIKIILGVWLLFFLPTKLLTAKSPIPAPDFKLQDTYQDIISLSIYQEKQPVLLLFWTTWDPQCKNELSELNNMYAGLVKEGIEVLSINSGESPDKVNDFIKNYNLGYRVLLDKDAAVTGLFKIGGFPVYVLINKKGGIVFQDSYFPYREYKNLIFD